MYCCAKVPPPRADTMESTNQKVLDQLRSLKRKVGVLSRKVKKREAMIEEIWEALKDMYPASGEEEEEEGEAVTATAISYSQDEGIMDADEVSSYTALKEEFKLKCSKTLGYRPTTPEIREMAYHSGGSITL